MKAKQNIISIKVITRAKTQEVSLQKDGSFKVKLTASPIDGKANKQLIKLLAGYFKIAPSSIEIIKGLTAKNKLVKLPYRDQIQK